MASPASRKEKRFLDELESLFTGAKVEGDSGFVNLMRIKQGYFCSIRPKLMEKIDDRATPDTAFRGELFDKLYTFFHRYFCESGSIYYRHLPAFSKTYERVYQDGQDIALSWKTQMLYYVKSDVLVRSMPVELNGEGNPTRHFYFDATECEHRQNNERRKFVFSFDKVKKEQAGRVIHLKVCYSQKGTKTKIDEVLKKVHKEGIRLSEDELEKAIKVFCRQTEVDFFINKDARVFLREQFDLWMYQYIFQEETIFEEKRIKQLQAIKDTAYDIIDFIAQFEDELRHVWEKPKFVRDVNYVVTLDRLADKVLKKIVKHQGAKAQIKEWCELGMVDSKFSMKDIFNGQGRIDDTNRVGTDYKFLPLDTKHFKDLELEILDCLGDLDEALDGELVHSENWQALNTLQRRYTRRVKCIYIDPPYNTGNDGFMYQDTVKHSSWITNIENRITLSKNILSKEGALLTSIDDNEQHHLRMILGKVFEEENFVACLIWSKRMKTSGVPPSSFSIANNEYVLAFQSAKFKFKGIPGSRESYRKDNQGRYYRTMPIQATGKQNNYFTIVNPENGNKHYGNWAFSEETIKQKTKNNEIVFPKEETQKPTQIVYYEKSKMSPILHYLGSFNSEDATKKFKQLGLTFDFPKPLDLIEYILNQSTSENSLVLDYFAGSGTTAHAVINLNRADDGKRKYLLIEMGEYFHTVLLPRIKKVIYSKDWREGKPASREGGSHSLKYYTLEQYEETLRNSRYEDGEQLELDSTKSPFEQYVFFSDDKLAHIVKPLKSGKLKINLNQLYPDIDIAESLSNILGKHIRKLTADSVSFEDGSTEKINPDKMNEEEKMHFISLLKPYLWWGNV